MVLISIVPKRSVDIATFIMCVSVFLSVILNGGVAFLGCTIVLFLVLVATLLVIKEMKHMCLNLLLTLFLFLIFNSAIISVGDLQVGLHEAEKWLVFVLVCLFATSYKNKTIILKTIGYTAFLAAVVGICCYSGIFFFEDFVFQELVTTWLLRIQSFFRYANTAACYFGIGYLSLFYLYFNNPNKKYLFCMSVINLAFYMTISKGAIVLFLVIGITFLFMKNEYGSVFFIQNFLSLVCALAAVILRISAPFAVLIVFAIHSYISVRVVDKLKLKKIYIVIALSVVSIIGIAVLFLYPDLATTFLCRVVYSSDAIKFMLQDFSARTLLGFGSGSWRVLQFKAQSVEYSVEHIHNGIVEIFFENGLIAGTIFCVIVIFSIIGYIKRKEYILTAMFCFILLHSLIDFDLSFTSILIVVGFLCGWSFPKSNNKIVVNEKFDSIKLFIPVAVIAFSCIVSVYTLTELLFRIQLKNEYDSGNYEKALGYSKSLESICPKDAELQYTISSLYERLDNSQEMEKHIKNAIYISPYDPRYYFSYMLVSDEVGVVEGCKCLISLSPNNASFVNSIVKYAEDKKFNGEISQIEYDEIIEYYRLLIGGAK